MHPACKNKEVVTDLKPLRQKADARRRLGEIGHVESTADITFPPRMSVIVPRNTTSARDFAWFSDTGAQSQPSAFATFQPRKTRKTIFVIAGESRVIA